MFTVCLSLTLLNSGGTNGSRYNPTLFNMIKVLILTVILLSLVLVGMSVKLIFDRKAIFRGSSCSSVPGDSPANDMSACCGGMCREDKLQKDS